MADISKSVKIVVSLTIFLITYSIVISYLISVLPKKPMVNSTSCSNWCGNNKSEVLLVNYGDYGSYECFCDGKPYDKDLQKIFENKTIIYQEGGNWVMHPNDSTIIFWKHDKRIDVMIPYNDYSLLNLVILSAIIVGFITIFTEIHGDDKND